MPTRAGKFTPDLLETGADVIALEPVDDMRQQLAAKLPAFDARPGSADSSPLADSSVDVVACTQAFRWFTQEIGKAAEVTFPNETSAFAVEKIG